MSEEARRQLKIRVLDSLGCAIGALGGEQIRRCRAQIDEVEIVIFHTAFNIIGGGEGGDRHNVHTKEMADHSLPYLAAVALLDGEVWPEQFMLERINRTYRSC
jgi:2-methylcitrate dehydratase PrpD